MSTRKGKGEQYFARCYQGKQCFFIVCGWKLVKKGSERMQSFFRVCVCVYNNCNRSRSRVVQGASTQRCRVGYCSSILIRLRKVSLFDGFGGSAVITFSREPQTSCPCRVISARSAESLSAYLA